MKFLYLYIVFSFQLSENIDNNINNISQENKTPKVVFVLKNEENIFLQLIEILKIIIKKKPIESILFLYNLLNNNSPKKVLEIFYINQQVLNILNGENQQINQEIEGLNKSLQEEPELKEFIEKQKLSQESLLKFIKLLVITKNMILQKYQNDAFYSTNYTLDNINTTKYFIPKKIFYVYFLTQDQLKKISLLINNNKVNKINNMNQLLNEINKISNNKTIVKDLDDYKFLNNNEYLISEVIINKKKFFKLVIGYEDIQQQINNLNFSLMIIKLTSNFSENQLNELFQNINKTPINNIIFFINQIIINGDIKVENYERHNEVPIESIINNRELFNIAINFPKNKYLLINQESYYLLYLILGTNTIDSVSSNIKSNKLMSDYILRHLI
jgi:hypothetical protein